MNSPSTHFIFVLRKNNIVKDFEGGLTSKYWYRDQWVDKQINRFKDELDEAVNRWRKLYFADKYGREQNNRFERCEWAD